MINELMQRENSQEVGISFNLMNNLLSRTKQFPQFEKTFESLKTKWICLSTRNDL